MKQFIHLIISFCLFGTLFSQNNVGIGILNPDPSALLDLSSTNKGLLVPRMTTSQMNAISIPYPSLLIYNTDSNCFAFRKGLEWKYICDVADSLVSNIGRIDTIYSSRINTDTIISQFGRIDTLISIVIRTDSIFAHYGRIDTLESNLVRTDSLIIRGIGIDSLIQQKAWLLDGNYIQNGQFIGSKNNEPVFFKVNNLEEMSLFQAELRLGRITNPNGNIDSSFGSRLSFLGGLGFSTTHNSENTDPIYMYRFNKGIDQTELRISIGDNFNLFGPVQDAFVIGGTHSPGTTFREAFRVNSNGRIVLPAAGTPDTGKVLTSIDNTGTAEWRTPTDNMPCGSVIMWAGALNAIPAGWYLCDGQNGTPDLRERFVMGASSSTDLYQRDGSNRVKLTEKEMPNHNHFGTTSANGEHVHQIATADDDGTLSNEGNITNADWGVIPSDRWSGYHTDDPDNGIDNQDNSASWVGRSGRHGHNVTTNIQGNAYSFEVTPEYYKLAYIHKCTGSVPAPIPCNITTTVGYTPNGRYTDRQRFDFTFMVTNNNFDPNVGFTGTTLGNPWVTDSWVYFPYSKPLSTKEAFSTANTLLQSTTNCIVAVGEWRRTCRYDLNNTPAEQLAMTAPSGVIVYSMNNATLCDSRYQEITGTAQAQNAWNNNTSVTVFTDCVNSRLEHTRELSGNGVSRWNGFGSKLRAWILP